MKILGIAGSAREESNTDILLNIALQEAKEKDFEISKVSLTGKSIAPCDGCGKCHKSGKCVVQDDMQEIYQQMLEADGILWATPVYFWSMTGQMKIVMDRTYSLTFPKLQLANKVGGAIIVAGSRGVMNTANIFHMYFRYNSMFFAETVTSYASGKGDIEKNEFAKLSAKEIASQMISIIKSRSKYPEEYNMPLHRFIKDKYDL